MPSTAASAIDRLKRIRPRFDRHQDHSSPFTYATAIGTKTVTFSLQGYSNGGRPAYGYQRKPIEVDGKPKVVWELHPEEADVVGKTFTWHLQGNGAREIARRLTEEGYLDRKGRPFAYNAILEWFRNPYRYAGYRCWNVHDTQP